MTKLFFRNLTLCLTCFSMLPFAALAKEALPLGVIQEVNGKVATVMFEADRPAVAPEEIVTTQSRIPGIDEVVESGKGYIESSDLNLLKITITEGEPAIGDEVLLHKEEFLHGSLSDDEKKWRKLTFTDVRGRGTDKKEKNIAAMCTMAYKYYHGEGVEKNIYDAFILSEYATRFDSPPPDCASMYGWLRLLGDMDQADNPRWDPNDQIGLKWVKYGAENGSYSGMTGYAMTFAFDKNYDQAEKWFKKAIAIEPEKLKGSAKKLLDNMHNFH